MKDIETDKEKRYVWTDEYTAVYWDIYFSSITKYLEEYQDYYTVKPMEECGDTSIKKRKRFDYRGILIWSIAIIIYVFLLGIT